MKSLSIGFLFLFTTFVHALVLDYPAEWWTPVSRDQAPSWEILPQDAGEGEVVLSKRGALGIFSNLGAAEFVYDGQKFGSVEGLWQMLKYPDPDDLSDPRHSLEYPYTRDQVRAMAMWESKEAGDLANDIMKANNIKFVSYKGRRFDYKDMAEGSAYHYELIYGASFAKITQNPEIMDLLRQTIGLKLIPDHRIRSTRPASYFYNEIAMKIRDELFD